MTTEESEIKREEELFVAIGTKIEIKSMRKVGGGEKREGNNMSKIQTMCGNKKEK